VERVVDDDAELIELQRAWLKMTNLLSASSPVRAKKTSIKKTAVRPKRNARGAGTVPAQPSRLHAIAEDSNSEISRPQISSGSEVPPIKRVRICDVIEEEKKSSDISEEEDL
jgi:hypothetical protein